MHILVLGAGGIGGYVGGRLVQSGGDVTFLVREARAASLGAKGLKIESPLGDFSSHVQVATRGEIDGPYDLVIFSCKAFDLGNAIASVGPVIGDGTAVLPFLNGIRHIDKLRAAFPRGQVLGGVAHLSVTLRPDGVIQHLTPLARFRFGAFDGASSSVPTTIAGMLERAGVDAVATQMIEQDMWDKFVFLATAAGITCLMRASIGDILETAAGEKLIRRMLAECVAVADAEGFAPSRAALADYTKTLTQRGSTFKASMLRDVERGARTEAEHIIGDLLRRASDRGVSATLLEIAATHLEAYELSRAA